jgi:carbamoyltransferase
VLGIADNHDAGATLVVDGRVVAAVSEERLDRVKNSGAFPARAIDAVLRLGGVRPDEVECIALGTAFTPAAPLRLLRDFHHRLKDDASQFTYLLHLYILYQVALQRLGLTGLETALSRPILRRDLAKWRFKAPLRFIDHHTAHASSAALTSPFDPALVITLDAMGDGTSVTVHRAEGGRLTPLFRQSGRAAVNTYYSRVTEYLGFKPLRHEGKITGLAAYAPAPPKLVAHFASMLRFVGPGFTTTDYLRPARIDDPFYLELGRYTREEIAAALQRNLEDQVCAFVAHWVRQTGIRDVALAGGTVANVKLNQRIHQAEGVRSIHVYPHMSDGGLPAGAAMLVAGLEPGPLPSPYLGPDITEIDARTALAAAGLRFERPDDMAGEVAALLAEGKVIARAAGRLEWGPRALGNRSILYRPDDRSVNDWLNKHLRRTEFMPFAPSTPIEEADRCYAGLDGARDAARFMTVCFDCTPWFAARCPGVVHVDNTARPQLVRLEDNPEYHAILTAFAHLTGAGTVINTSFNMHEEPIVASAEDAVRAWIDAGLDALVLGPYMARRDA